MRRPASLLVPGIVLLLAAFPAAAQTSASYRLTESVLNAGGHPEQGTVSSSTSYRVSLDSIGDGRIGDILASGSYRLDGGFVAVYPPPGEVLGVRFPTKTLMTWNPEKSVGSYDVYQSTLGSLPGSYGSCLANGLLNPSLPVSAVPAIGGGSFYLVTARDRLAEEGTKGWRSNGAERPNLAPCP